MDAVGSRFRKWKTYFNRISNGVVDSLFGKKRTSRRGHEGGSIHQESLPLTEIAGSVERNGEELLGETSAIRPYSGNGDAIRTAYLGHPSRGQRIAAEDVEKEAPTNTNIAGKLIQIPTPITASPIDDISLDDLASIISNINDLYGSVDGDIEKLKYLLFLRFDTAMTKLWNLKREREESASAKTTMDPVTAFFLRPKEERKRLLAQITPDSNAGKILATLYGGPTRSATVKSKTIKAQYNGEKITLTSEQSYAINLAKSDEPLTIMQAGFGCGKTLTLALAQAHQVSSCGKGHLVLAASNHAVVNAVYAAAKLDGFKDRKIVRLISAENRKEHPEIATDYDLPHLMCQYFEKKTARDRLNPKNRRIVEEFLKTTRKPKEDEDDKANRINFNKVMWLFLRRYRPSRLFATIDTGVGKFLGALKNYPVGSVFIDEASQLGEGTFFVILATFPRAKFCLVGDDRQLPPFCPSDAIPFLKRLAIGNLFDRIVEKRLFPLAKLSAVYRSHPQITDLLSKVFYNGELKSAVREEDRNRIIKLLEMTNPWSFLDCNGQQEQCGTSKRNMKEAQLIAELVTLLVEKKNVKAEDIAVLTLHIPQNEAIVDGLKKSAFTEDVAVCTVDSAQGKEWPVTIVSTVRTKSRGNEDFLCDPKRINVALSRAKEACFIAGSQDLLSRVNTWKLVIEELQLQGCCETARTFIDRQYSN